jgi:hypothetical protein
MTGYRPGPQTHRGSRGPDGPRRTLGPYGPREDDDPYLVRGAFDPYDAVRPAPARPAPARSAPARPRPAAAPASLDRTGGADGNERLTAATGAVLLVLFAAEGVTILSIHQLITVHFFLGMLLIGPVLLKAASVCYRFVRYYSGATEYRRKGPPAPLLRLLGPVVLGTSLGVLGTGVMLGVTGSAAGPWLFLHKAFFVLWFCAMTVHVLAYAWRLPSLIGADLRGHTGFNRTRQVLGGRRARWLLLGASILAGLVIALMTVHLSAPWQGFHSFG